MTHGEPEPGAEPALVREQRGAVLVLRVNRPRGPQRPELRPHEPAGRGPHRRSGRRRACPGAGLVNQVVAPGQVLDAVLDLAERIARNGPPALRATKELVRLWVTDAGAAAERQRTWQSTVFASEDAREGAAAFVQKRDPVWRGR